MDRDGKTPQAARNIDSKSGQNLATMVYYLPLLRPRYQVWDLGRNAI